jgi:hypothetical protein
MGIRIEKKGRGKTGLKKRTRQNKENEEEGI